jgi:S1-C subfamily serine protease
MAHNISRFLKQHPGWQMIALTGSGHIMHGNGIPQDLAQQNPNLKIATVISGTAGDVQAGMVNYVVQTQPLDLPATGKLGVMLDQTPTGVVIKALMPKGAAMQVGLQKQDRIVGLNHQSIQNLSQLLQQLSQFAPKEVINLEIARTGQSKPLRYRVTLQ